MGDLISRSALLQRLRDKGWLKGDMTDSTEMIAVQSIIDDAPAVDAVEAVRCKDCEYFDRKVSVGGFCKCGEVNGGRPFARVNDDFCSYGERRADDGSGKLA